MKLVGLFTKLGLMLVFSVGLVTSARAKATTLDGDEISRLTGLGGQMNQKEGVYKVSFPRIERESKRLSTRKINNKT